MKSAFDKMMTGLDEVEAFLAGQRDGFKVRVPDEVDVKAIRKRLRLTQAGFSSAFGFSLDAVRNWETRRRQPEAAARVLLTVIEKDPAAVVAALHSGKVRARGPRGVHEAARKRSGPVRKQGGLGAAV